jgi:Tfp pilus assembly protein FimT
MFNVQFSMHDLQKIFSESIFINKWKLKIGAWKFSRGFTMVELLLYMGILVILLSVLTGIFSTVIDVQLESKGTSVTQMDGRYILSRLSYDIERASAVTVPTLASQSAAMNLTINGQNVSYALDSDRNLIVTEASVSAQLNSFATSLDAISFRQIGNSIGGKNTVQILYTIRSKAQSARGADVKTYTTTVGMR